MEYIILFSLLALFLYVISQALSSRSEMPECEDKEIHKGEPVALWERFGFEIVYYPESESFSLAQEIFNDKYFTHTVLPTFYGFIDVYEKHGHYELIAWYKTGMTKWFIKHSLPDFNWDDRINNSLVAGNCEEYYRLLYMRHLNLI